MTATEYRHDAARASRRGDRKMRRLAARTARRDAAHRVSIEARVATLRAALQREEATA